VGRATATQIYRCLDINISIHALRGEGDLFLVHIYTPFQYFNPRPPWGGRPETWTGVPTLRFISIHALRGEGDFTVCFRNFTHADFNPRPPWGGRLLVDVGYSVREIFQSTPSVGRATLQISIVCH